MVIGLLVGFIASYITKRMRFLAQSVVSETVFIFCFALESYYIAAMAGCSGVISLLITSIVTTHYAWHNLSP